MLCRKLQPYICGGATSIESRTLIALSGLDAAGSSGLHVTVATGSDKWGLSARIKVDDFSSNLIICYGSLY